MKDPATILTLTLRESRCKDSQEASVSCIKAQNRETKAINTNLLIISRKKSADCLKKPETELKSACSETECSAVYASF